mmetsp:Transcript_46453/g.61534  ORF Transcript_46453/g.61534 Transcript_46453/m.61534 type:complete len:262 (+) Transcript_46453:1898-2683(+)
MEFRATAKLDLLRLLILDHFKEVLGLHGVERGHQRRLHCHLVCVWVLGVDQLRNEHVCSSVEQVDTAARLIAAHQNVGFLVVLLDELRVGGHANISDARVRDDAHLIREGVGIRLLVLHTVLLVVWEVCGRHRVVIVTADDLKLSQDGRLESRLLAGKQVTELDGHQLIFFAALSHDGSLAATDSIFVLLLGLLLVLDFGLNNAVVNAGLELGDRGALLNREGVGALERGGSARIEISQLHFSGSVGASELALNADALEWQ